MVEVCSKRLLLVVNFPLIKYYILAVALGIPLIVTRLAYNILKFEIELLLIFAY